MTTDRGLRQVDLGSDSSSEQQIDAVVDDLGIWDIVLSSAEISTLYNGGNGTAIYPRTEHAIS